MRIAILYFAVIISLFYSDRICYANDGLDVDLMVSAMRSYYTDPDRFYALMSCEYQKRIPFELFRNALEAGPDRLILADVESGYTDDVGYILLNVVESRDNSEKTIRYSTCIFLLREGKEWRFWNYPWAGQMLPKMGMPPVRYKGCSDS